MAENRITGVSKVGDTNYQPHHKTRKVNNRKIFASTFIFKIRPSETKKKLD